MQALGLPTAPTPYCVDGLLRQSSTGDARSTCVPGYHNFTFDTLVRMFELFSHQEAWIYAYCFTVGEVILEFGLHFSE